MKQLHGNLTFFVCVVQFFYIHPQETTTILSSTEDDLSGNVQSGTESSTSSSLPNNDKNERGLDSDKYVPVKFRSDCEMNRPKRANDSDLSIELQEHRYNRTRSLEILLSELSQVPDISKELFLDVIQNFKESICFAFIDFGADKHMLDFTLQPVHRSQSSCEQICVQKTTPFFQEVLEIARQRKMERLVTYLVSIKEQRMSFPMLYARDRDIDGFMNYYWGHGALQQEHFLKRVWNYAWGKQNNFFYSYKELYCIDNEGRTALWYATGVYPDDAAALQGRSPKPMQMQIDIVRACLSRMDLRFAFPSCDTNNPFILAAEEGESEVVKLFLDKFSSAKAEEDENGKKEIDALEQWVVTLALTIASEKGHAEVVKAIIDGNKSSQLQSPQPSPWRQKLAATGLIESSAHSTPSHLEICLFLFKSGAQSNLFLFGRTALFRAAKYGNVDGCKLLLEKDADPNILCQDGSPLLVAAFGATLKNSPGRAKRYVEICKLLINGNAKVEQKDSAGRTALFHALNAQDKELVLLLCSKGACTVQPHTNLSSLAAQNGMIEEVGVLEEEFRRNNILQPADKEGRTILMILASNGHADKIARLCAKQEVQKSIDIKDHKGRTALMHAALTGKIDCFLCLLMQGADPHIKRASNNKDAFMMLQDHPNLHSRHDWYRTSFKIFREAYDTDKLRNGPDNSLSEFYNKIERFLNCLPIKKELAEINKLNRRVPKTNILPVVEEIDDVSTDNEQSDNEESGWDSAGAHDADLYEYSQDIVAEVINEESILSSVAVSVQEESSSPLKSSLFNSPNFQTDLEKPHGMKNLGNSCYEISALQCIFLMKPLNERFRAAENSPSANSLLGTYKPLLCNYSVEAANRFHDHALQEFGRERGMQDDASLFFRQALDGLVNELGRQEAVQIKNILSASLLSEFRSIADNNILSTNNTLEWVLPLDITVKDIHLGACLDRYFQPVNIDYEITGGSPDDKALRSKRLTPATKRYSLAALPRYLCLQIPRIVGAAPLTPKGNGDVAAAPAILTPLAFDLETAFNQYVNSPSNKNDRYQLVGAIFYEGPDKEGHYTAYVKYNNCWYYCNDSTISRVNNMEKIAARGWGSSVRSVPTFFMYEQIIDVADTH